MSVPPISSRPLTVQVWTNLDRVYGRLTRRVAGHLATYGLTTPQFRVLRQIQDADLSPSDIADRIGVTPGNLTGVIDRLEQEELLVRHRGEDRRYLTLRIAPKGTALLERVVPEMYQRLADIFSPLDEAEIQQFIDMLCRIEDHLDLTTEVVA